MRRGASNGLVIYESRARIAALGVVIDERLIAMVCQYACSRRDYPFLSSVELFAHIVVPHHLV
jgi:hypothetical protein